MKKVKKEQKLTDSQIEIIRFLGKGSEIYLDDRGKWRLTLIKRNDGTTESAVTGHSRWFGSPPHLYRPTVEFFAEEKIIVGYFDKESGLPKYSLNTAHPKFKDQIKIAIVEGALGVTRKTINRK